MGFSPEYIKFLTDPLAAQGMTQSIFNTEVFICFDNAVIMYNQY